MGDFMDTERIKSYLDGIFALLIILDLFLIIISLPIPGIQMMEYDGFVESFDLTICFLLIVEFFYGLIKAKKKMEFTKEHIFDLIASIPFDLLPIPVYMNVVRSLRLIRIIRLIRALNIKDRLGLEKVIKQTHLDKFLVVVTVLVIFFTVLLYFSGVEDITESFYFVIITLTTVGYGDDVIDTPVAKFMSIFLIIAGVLVFSTITGVISSYFTDRLLEDDDHVDEDLQVIKGQLNVHEKELENGNKELKEVKNELANANNELKEVRGELEKANQHSEDLKKELDELKQLIKEK